MSREPTDLLDVFRGRPAKSSGARAVSRPVSDRRRGGDVQLSRRQVLLGGAALGLLVLLAFVGGTAVGKGRRESLAMANVAKPAPATPVYQFRSRELSRLSAQGGDLQAEALDSFAKAFPQLVPGLSSIRAEDARGREKPGAFRLLVRGFQNRTQANNWLFAVKGWSVGGLAPFEDSRPEPAP